MLPVLREIFKGTTFYYKQLNLFLLCLVTLTGIVGVRYYAESQTPQASTDLPRALAPQAEGSQVSYDIVVHPNGRTVVNGRTVPGAITYSEGRGKFLLVLIPKADVYTRSVEAKVTLPFSVDSMDTVSPHIYAVHGVGNSRFVSNDRQTVTFYAQDIFEGAELSIGFTFPEGYLKLSPIGAIQSYASSLSLPFWINFGLFVIPTFTLLVLGFLILKKIKAYKQVSNNQVYPLAPQALPPAVVGALYHGQIGKREIAATLFDLANRGFLIIHHGSDMNVTFSKGGALYGQQANTLRPFEVLLLHQIFGQEGFASRSKSIEAGLESELFSSKIAMTFVNIYDAVVAEGFFIQSPNKYYLKYKIVGMVLFFISLAALIYGSFNLPEPAYILFVWVGAMIASLIIVNMTPGLPRRTDRGNQILKQWMGFRNYLTWKKPIGTSKSSEFFAYLPYALTFECEHAWIARWENEVLTLPKWFSTEHTPYTAKDYQESIISVVEYLSGHLVAARPPDVA